MLKVKPVLLRHQGWRWFNVALHQLNSPQKDKKYRLYKTVLYISSPHLGRFNPTLNVGLVNISGHNWQLWNYLPKLLCLMLIWIKAHITLHTRKIPSHSSKKSRRLWPVMMDDSAPIHERRKLVKIYKNVLPQKRTMVAKVCGETYSKKWLKAGVEKPPLM